MDGLGPWAAARRAWILLILGSLPASVLLWFIGGYSFCGTDTTEPGEVGDWACGALVEPVVPWVLIAATPLLSLVAGGLVALRRESWRLFALAVVGPPLAIAGAYLALGIAF